MSELSTEKTFRKLRLRCPCCSRLYEVSESDIHSQSPQFDCISCATRFGFSYPVANPAMVEVYVVQTGLPTEVVVAPPPPEKAIPEPQAAQKNSTKPCPKCGAINEKKNEECYSCHVIFARLEQLPLDPTLKAQPSLVRKWKNLVLNFDNKELHEDFLESCHRLEALRFAILKYEELKKAQGGSDETCESMIFKAHGLLQVTLSGKKEGDLRFAKPTARSTKEAPRHKWHRYILWGPLAVSALMIITGFFSLGLRNLVGAGVAVMLLTFGLILFWKGRISLSDFR